jgi:hypothetical protein
MYRFHFLKSRLQSFTLGFMFGIDSLYNKTIFLVGCFGYLRLELIICKV